MATTCAALTYAGKPCKRPPRKNGKYCEAHKGYRAKKNPGPPPADLKEGQTQCAAINARGVRCRVAAKGRSKFCGRHQKKRKAVAA